MDNYLGREGLSWFFGVIEDRNDPLFLNRVRVRIYGAHTHDKQKIATPDLPWAEVLMPTTSPSLSGLGLTTHGLVEGSTVMGFYRDGQERQEPVVMGSFIGIPQQYYRIDEKIDDKGTRSFSKIGRTTTDGFNDPRLSDASSYEGTPDGVNPPHIQRTEGLTLDLKNSPRKDGLTAGVNYPKSEYIGNSDVNFLSQGDSTKYPIINLAKGEPNREYVQPKYPFNHVTESESGHVIEIDDTPNYERLHLFHRKGTRLEVDKDGTAIEKIVKDKYTLILGENKVKIQGAVDIEIGESIASNAVAAAGGASALTASTITNIVDSSGKLTEATKTKLKATGITDEQIETVESAGTFSEALSTATEEALDVFTDSTKVNDNATISAVLGVVEGVSQGADGVESVIAQVSEAVPDLPTEAITSLTNEFNTLSNIADNPTTLLTSDGIETLSNSVTASIDSATSILSNIPGVTGEQLTAVGDKLTSVLGSASAGIESMNAVVTEKVSAAVTTAVTAVFGEEAAAQAAEVVSEQMVGAISGVALGAVAGAFGSALVNIDVAGGAKIKTKGSANLISFGSTSITTTMSTNITTLTGGTNITTLVGNTNITNAVGAINLTAPLINSTGIFNHNGLMNVTGLLTGTAITAPIIQSGAAFLATHTHVVPGVETGAGVANTLPGAG